MCFIYLHPVNFDCNLFTFFVLLFLCAACGHINEKSFLGNG